MLTLLTILHLFIGLALVLFVLLQDPKGGAMGVFSGGSSSSSFFGASGASNFLTSATRWLAIAFAVSCLVLTYITASSGSSIMNQGPVPNAPAADPATPGEGQSAPVDAAPSAPAPAEVPAAPKK